MNLEKTPGKSGKVDEERLGRILISRGLITEEEARQHRTGTGPESFLKRLADSGVLGRGQTQRILQELPSLGDQHIPGYQLLDTLGEGASAAVFKARQLSMNRLVAIKVLKGKHTGNPEFLERFRREAQLAAKLSHNNIVQAIDVASVGNLHYVVMEYVEGKTVQAVLDSGKIYPEKEAVEIILQIAQALTHAHRRGLVHRDIKPANILVTPEGIAKLADLGTAREKSDVARAKAEKGITIGTPFYIAPEQVLGKEDIDARADMYALGATLYHMVTGQPPFPGPGIDAVLNAHLKKELTPPDHLNQALSAGVGEVAEFMMAKDRRDRYQSLEALTIDLECLLNKEPPRMARQKIEALKTRDPNQDEDVDEEIEVVDNDDADEEEVKPKGKKGRKQKKPTEEQQQWTLYLGVALGVSLLLNLLFLLLALK